MEIIGKVHCFFEQSGTFKNEFIKLGIPAEDYDIQNNFGETDHVIDLFREIEEGYEGRPSIFDGITPDDLVMAFFPCIYFSCVSQMNMSLTSKNNRNLAMRERYATVLARSKRRQTFLELLIKLMGVCEINSKRLIVENPWSMQTYLKNGFIKPPSLIDLDRASRGDYFRKPTAFWFVGCEPCKGIKSIQPNPEPRKINSLPPVKGGGICNVARSMISPDYARNFICDFILGREQEGVAQQLTFKEFDNISK